MNRNYSMTNGAKNTLKSINHGAIIGQPFCVSSARMAAVSKAGYLYDRYSESGLMLPQQLFQQLFLRQDSCKLVQMVFLHVPYSSS